MQSYFKVPKDVLNTTNFCIMKIPNKRKLQQIAYNHSSDIDFKDFMNLYRKCTAKIYSFLVMHASCIRQSFTFQRESFRKNIKTTHDNSW